jgi:hypothetical protein
MTRCLRLGHCFPCAPGPKSDLPILEKLEVERSAVLLFSEGKISSDELDRIILSDRAARERTASDSSVDSSNSSDG